MPASLVPLAIIYDFDGTLAPGNMQDRQFIPDIGMTTSDFWQEVDQLAEENQADGILSYMFVMLEKAKLAGIPVRQDDLVAKSREIEFFPGVEGWFDRIDAYAQGKGVSVKHYVISSGNSEIIEGTSIARKFTRIYASKFLYDAEGFAVWPAVAINFTTKTQYLFRINKGAHDWKDSSIINKYVPQGERPVPFLEHGLHRRRRDRCALLPSGQGFGRAIHSSLCRRGARAGRAVPARWSRQLCLPSDIH